MASVVFVALFQCRLRAGLVVVGLVPHDLRRHEAVGAALSGEPMPRLRSEPPDAGDGRVDPHTPGSREGKHGRREICLGFGLCLVWSSTFLGIGLYSSWS